MERKDFIRRACTFCGCASLAIFAGSTVKAAVKDDPEDWRIAFMQTRFSEMIGKMKVYIPENDRHSVIMEVGRYCANENKTFDQFVGNVEGFLEKIKGSWIENYKIDKEKNIIHMYGTPKDKCGCPLSGKNNNISAEFCNCSKGYMESAMAKMTGKTAHVAIDSSVLMGGDRCSFTIQLS